MQIQIKSFDENIKEYERLVAVFKAHNIQYFFYNGGNDSADTAHKVSLISSNWGIQLIVLLFQKLLIMTLLLQIVVLDLGQLQNILQLQHWKHL